MPKDFFNRILCYDGLNSYKEMFSTYRLVVQSGNGMQRAPFNIPTQGGTSLVPVSGDLENYNGKLYFTDINGFRDELIPTINRTNFNLTEIGNLVDYLNQWLDLGNIGAGLRKISIPFKFTATGNVTIDLRMVNNSNAVITYFKDFTLSNNIEATLNLTAGTTLFQLLNDDIVEIPTGGATIQFKVNNGNLAEPFNYTVTQQKANYSFNQINPYIPPGI